MHEYEDGRHGLAAFCDTCGERITAHCFVVWNSDDPSDFRIIHQERCDPGRPRYGSSLDLQTEIVYLAQSIGMHLAAMLPRVQDADSAADLDVVRMFLEGNGYEVVMLDDGSRSVFSIDNAQALAALDRLVGGLPAPDDATTRLRDALHAAVESADLVCEAQSLVAPVQAGKQVAVQVPTEKWGALCTAIREVLDAKASS